LAISFVILIIFTTSNVYAGETPDTIIEFYNVPDDVDVDILVKLDDEGENSDVHNLDIVDTEDNVIWLTHDAETKEYIPTRFLANKQVLKDSGHMSLILFMDRYDPCTIAIMTKADGEANISESVEYPSKNTYSTYVYDYADNSFIESEEGRVNEEAQAFARGFAKIILDFLLIFVVLNLVLTAIELVVINLVSKEYKFKIWHIFIAIFINFCLTLIYFAIR